MLERTSADITIYGINGQSIATVPITAASKRVVKLMESDYIQLSFTLSEAVAFPVGSYCDDELFGRFYVTEEQMPKYNTSNGGYDYELRMDAWYWMWNLKQCMLTTSFVNSSSLTRKETVWYLTNSLKEQMRVFLCNLQVLGFLSTDYDFLTDDTDLLSIIDITADVTKATEALTVSYNSTHMIDVLKNLADTWECEYWVTGNESSFLIHFGKCENGTLEGISLQTNAQNITPQDDTSERGDKLFYFGGTDNIPNTYRKTIRLTASDIETNNGVVAYFKTVDDAGRYAKITPGHVGGVDATIDGWKRSKAIGLRIADSDRRITTNFDTLDYTDRLEAMKTIINNSSGHEFESVEVLPELPTSFVFGTLYVRYIDNATGVVDTDMVYNIFPYDHDEITVQSVYMQAYNLQSQPQAVTLAMWRAISRESYDAENDIYVFGISDEVLIDEVGSYVTANIGGAASAKIYLSQEYSQIVFDNIEEIDEELDWNCVTHKYAYETCAVCVPTDYNVLSFRAYLCDIFNNQWVALYHDSQEYIFNIAATGYLGDLANINGATGSDDRNYLIYSRPLIKSTSISETMTLHCDSQRITIGMWVTAAQYENMADVMNFIPQVRFGFFDALYWGWGSGDNDIRNCRIGNFGRVKLSYDLQSIEIRKDSLVRYGNYYYLQYAIDIPSLDYSTVWFRNLYSTGYYPVLLVTLPFNASALHHTPLRFSLYEDGTNDTYTVEVIQQVDGTETKWLMNGNAPTTDIFHAGTRLYLYEITDGAPLWNIPYAYWVDEFDNPASLLSIGDRRLQLPVYDETEFNRYKTDGMTYEDGYIVKDGMAYKDGYIISSEWIGDDDNRSLRELTVTDDNVYPDGKLLVKMVDSVNKTENDEVEGESVTVPWNWQQYHLQVRRPADNTDLPFDRSFILPNGEALKIRFLVPEDVKAYYESGDITQAQWEAIQSNCKMAGMQFEVEFNSSIRYQGNNSGVLDTHTMDYAIVRNEDFGTKLPNEVLRPSVYDPCVLVNWNVRALVSLGLIAEAEYRLLDKAFEYYAALRNGNFTFTAEIMSDWLFDLVGGLQFVDSDGKNVIDSDSKNFLVKNEHEVYAIPQLGQRVRVTHAALTDGYKDTRIIGMELSLDKPYDTPKLTIGETEAYSRLKQIEKEITKRS